MAGILLQMASAAPASYRKRHTRKGRSSCPPSSNCTSPCAERAVKRGASSLHDLAAGASLADAETRRAGKRARLQQLDGCSDVCIAPTLPSNAPGQASMDMWSASDVTAALLRDDGLEMDHFMPFELTVSKEHNAAKFVQMLRLFPALDSVVDPGRRPLLKPRRARAPQRKTLVLDMDNTLIFSMVEVKATAELPALAWEMFDGEDGTTYAFLRRPHLKTFLQRAADLFEVVVWTAGLKEYAKPLLDCLDPKGRLFSKRLYRSDCLPVQLRGKQLNMKDLSALGRELSHTVIIENSPLAFSYQVDNGVPVSTWKGDSNDEELLDLSHYLEQLHAADDVRDVVRSHPFHGAVRDAMLMIGEDIPCLAQSSCDIECMPHSMHDRPRMWEKDAHMPSMSSMDANMACRPWQASAVDIGSMSPISSMLYMEQDVACIEAGRHIDDIGSVSRNRPDMACDGRRELTAENLPTAASVSNVSSAATAICRVASSGNAGAVEKELSILLSSGEVPRLALSDSDPSVRASLSGDHDDHDDVVEEEEDDEEEPNALVSLTKSVSVASTSMYEAVGVVGASTCQEDEEAERLHGQALQHGMVGDVEAWVDMAMMVVLDEALPLPSVRCAAATTPRLTGGLVMA